MIKFRAWNGYRKIMADYVSAIQNGDTQGTSSSVNVIINRKNETWDIKNDDVELLQFTGLKDTNGKEIYESDILRVTTGEDGESYVATVKWFGDEGYPAFDLAGIPAAWYYDSSALATIFEGGVGTCEAIGNIFDNPKPLEGKR